MVVCILDNVLALQGAVGQPLCSSGKVIVRVWGGGGEANLAYLQGTSLPL